MVVKTADVLEPNYPNLAKFVRFLWDKVQNPTIKADERKEAELVLKDIRLLVEKVLGQEKNKAA